MRKSLFLLLAVAAASVACSGSPEGPSSSLGTSRSKIIGGTTSTADQNAVVLLIHTDRQTSFGACTGTLIAPNLVLTARHCVSNVNDAPFGCKEDGTPVGDGGSAGSDLKPSEFYIFTGTDRPQFGGATKKAAARGKKVFHDSSKSLCGHDVSLILLDTEIEGAEIMPLRLDDLPKAGETFTAVGWGVTDRTDFPSKRMQRAGIKVEKVGPFKGTYTDAPLPANDFRVGEAICSGDSGGPGIAEDTHAIIGVVSRGGNGNNTDTQDPAANCTGEGTENEYTSVAPFKDLILQAFEEAGHDPWYEGGPDPRLAKFDDPCDGPDACRSGLCTSGKCTQSCADGSECPEGFECAADGADKICKVPAPKAAATNNTASAGCIIGGVGSAPIGPVVPWLLAGLGMIARRRRRSS
jgi:MYXO-CTERM domain-containing protein